MKTIKNNVTTQYEIKKSIFITKLIKIDNIDLVKKELDKVKKEYKDATHYCYGYIIDNNKKASDDKEPSGTASVPIMEILERNQLNHILCIVIRYFGGIKLGAGGLLRAYMASCSNAVKNADIVDLIEGFRIKIIATYEQQNIIEQIIKSCNYTKEYIETVIYEVECNENILEKLKDYNIKYIIIEKKFISN